MEQAILAAGCFWGVQYYFYQVPGVVETTAGYTGGTTDDPTYDEVCSHTTGHAEAVLVEFDVDAVIAGNAKASGVRGASEQWTESSKRDEAFRIILRHFFRLHDPTQLNGQGPDIGDNYRSAIFYVTDEQQVVAEKVRDELQSKYGGKIVTEITEAGPFYEAEDYHQKFTERTGRGASHVDYEPLS